MAHCTLIESYRKKIMDIKSKILILSVFLSSSLLACSADIQATANKTVPIVKQVADNNSKYIAIINKENAIAFSIMDKPSDITDQPTTILNNIVISNDTDGMKILFPTQLAHPIYNANQQIIGLDFNNDGKSDSLTFCTSNEGEHFNAWSGQAYTTKRTAYSYRYINAELMSNCKEIEVLDY